MFHEKYQEIFDLILRINRETSYAAFFTFHGHVDCISVWISKEKRAGYNDRMYSSDFFSMVGEQEDLNEIINDLKSYVEVKK